jgi:Phage virion morphogenesis family
LAYDTMTMPSINLEFIIDDTQVERLLSSLETGTSDVGLSEWLRGDALQHLQSRAKARFASEGDDITGPWAPLSPYTQAIRESEGYPPSHPINVRTGELLNFITNSPADLDITAEGVALNYPSRSMTPDMASKIATAQGGGSLDNRSKLAGTSIVPARPVIGVNEADAEFILISLSEHLLRDLLGYI